jgi:lipopolysaccharide/colanic/teichoic acid biosynthesis glycosyltransferase
MEAEHRGTGKGEKLSDTPEKMTLRIQHDLWYIQSGFLWLDLEIEMKTALVLVHRNAY